MMKKQWILPWLLILALLLSACAGQGTGAGTGTPESDAADAPSSAEARPARPKEDTSEAEPEPEPEPAVHTLTEEEMAALWQQLDGIWRLNDPENPGPGTEWLYAFSHYDSGAFVFTEALIASDGGSQYVNEVTERNGRYTLYIYETGSLGYFNEYEPDARGVVTLVLREDGTLVVHAYAPPRYGQETSRWEEGWGEDIGGRHWRLATAQEVELLNSSMSRYLELENGDMITQSHTSEPVYCHRETPEEEQVRMNGWW